MSEKITASHRERAAYVYVRQSTLHQVQNHLESQRRQYALEGRAREFGFGTVVVVDEDLGRSGSGSQARPGFARLLAAVCEGQVGVVLALEASRLARNNRDWHHLLDLCALANTLVVDHDGVYDPKLLNDRLLLGLKGTMSEFELGLLRQRGLEAYRQMIRRGEVLTEVPIGYVRTESNSCEMTPDRQVQEGIRSVFAKYRELGSARQVLLWYRQEEIPLPTGRGSEVSWKVPVYGRILAILTNPIYAGTFVHGRTRSKTRVVDGRARKTHGHAVPRDEWEVVIHGHHEGYITWDEYLQNQKTLESNAGMRGLMRTGAAKTGPALLAGLLRCGRCGRKLHVGYSGVGGRVPRYFCRGGSINHGVSRCISFGGLRPDQAVVNEVLAAVESLGVEASIQAWEQRRHQEDEKAKALRLAVEKARYEAERAKRQYDAVDPENRLVASELEQRWNTALQSVAALEARLNESSPERAPVSKAEKSRLMELGGDLKALWQHPKAPVSLKKRILRTTFTEIVAEVFDDPPEVRLLLHWAGGVHTKLRVTKNRTGHHGRSTDREAVDLVRELAKICRDSSIAAILNRLGYQTGAGNNWNEGRIRTLRSYHRIAAFDEKAPRQWITRDEASKALGVSSPTVGRFIAEGILPGRQVVRHAPWVIDRDHLNLPAVREAVNSVQRGRRRPRNMRGHNVIPFPEQT